MWGTEGVLRRGQSTRSFREVLVNDGQGPGPARLEDLEMMMPKGELSVAAFDTGVGALAVYAQNEPYHSVIALRLHRFSAIKYSY